MSTRLFVDDLTSLQQCCSVHPQRRLLLLMAPSRGRTRPSTAAKSSVRKNAQHASSSRVPEVFQEMLAETTTDGEDFSDRPLKRRKVNRTKPDVSAHSSARHGTDASVISPLAMSDRHVRSHRPAPPRLQTVEASSDSDDDEEDLDFEDIDLDAQASSDVETNDQIQDVSISLQPERHKVTPSRSKRRPATSAEKQHRLFVHKLHILCLLAHCMYVNGRCNNEKAQRHLLSILSTKTKSYLNPASSFSQFQKDRSFTDGLNQAVEAFNMNFSVTASGMAAPHWQIEGSSVPSIDSTDMVDRADFIEAAKSFVGSQDLGNHLFCALLRSAGVTTRLICSLQPLPFVNLPKPTSTTPTPHKEVILAIAPDRDLSAGELSDISIASSAGLGKVPAARRRIGQQHNSVSARSPKTPNRSNKSIVRKLAYPVFWVEAWNAALQRWVPIDPVVTRSIDRPSKIQPSASYDLNRMLYVIAFESDGVARDVTKRYARQYNAKTRRHRIDGASEDEQKWWRRVMRFFRRRGGPLDRDQVEEAELASKEAKEGMPTNVLDFKGHPYYALERHLKRHEVIHPKREAGKVNAGTAAKPRMEVVYRRSDVVQCKSADKWYRQGRTVRPGEQPLKLVPSQARRQTTPENRDSADQETNGSTIGLYSFAQTDLYYPEPVRRGRIVKNAFGNLDVYVPSMVPAGGVHIRQPMASKAAQMIKVDYADAVVGFKFKGRHGTAVIDGVVVAEQFGPAISAVVEGFEADRIEDESRARSLEALRLWKKFITGLRIADRVSGYADTGEQQSSSSRQKETSREDVIDLRELVVALQTSDQPLPTAGKYSLADAKTRAKPKKPKKKTSYYDTSDDEDDFVPDGDTDVDQEADGLRSYDGEGGFMQEDATSQTMRTGLTSDEDQLVEISDNDADDDMGCGFIVEDPISDNGEGGYIVEDAEQSEEAENGGGFMVEEDDLGTGGTFIVEDDPIEMPQTRSAVQDNTSEIKPSHTAPTSSNESRRSRNSHKGHRRAAIADTIVKVAEEKALVEDTSEKESLLSHDPDDDDAEPDWMDSD